MIAKGAFFSLGDSMKLKYQLISQAFKKIPKDTWVCLPFLQTDKKPLLATSEKNLPFVVTLPSFFKGKKGEVEWVSNNKQVPVVAFGLGEVNDLEPKSIREAYGELVAYLNQKKIKKAQIVIADLELEELFDMSRWVSESLLSKNYNFDKYKSHKSSLLESVELLGSDKNESSVVKEVEKEFMGIYLCRDLVNQNADEITSNHLVNLAKKMAKDYSELKVSILGEKELKAKKLNLLLAVNQASKNPPALICFEYTGDTKKTAPIALVGKGVTYDTGGLSLKSSDGMLTMKSDMSGAGAVFGAIHALCQLKPKKNFIGIIPVVENCIGSSSYKVGDVFEAYNKKTVEVVNTDAEGRLILGDALAYAIKTYQPRAVIDICTLTGAIVVALGKERMGLMSNDDELAESLEELQDESIDKVWQMPMDKEYCSLLKSDIADFKNAGGREGASIIAACFLQEFVEKTPWAHLDIAGTAYRKKATSFYPVGATGSGVQLLIRLIEHF